MDNNNNGLRRSSRPAAILALSALVAACQATGPEHVAPPPVPVASAIPLEPIVLPSLQYRDVIVEEDLLTRLRSRFAWEIKEDPAIERERAWYAKNQAYLDRVFTRGDLYLYHIVGELEALLHRRWGSVDPRGGQEALPVSMEAADRSMPFPSGQGDER